MTDNAPYFPTSAASPTADLDTHHSAGPRSPDIDTASTDTPTPSPTPPTIRADGWYPIRQRVFLESLAETGVVTQACDECGISPRSAYNLRIRADGVGFRLGWEAAILIARGRLVDTLMARAINGWEEIITRFGYGSDERTHHRIDNRLAMSLLGRLDKRAEVPLTEGTDAALARIVAQDFEAFLDLIASGAGGAAISLFLALRTPKIEGQNQETNPHQNDAIERCELCGAGHDQAASEAEDEDPYAEALAGMGVWCDDPSDPENPRCWRTEYPAPPDFDGQEWGAWNSDWYERTLTQEELDAQIARKDIPQTTQADDQDFLQAAKDARDAYFGFTAGEAV
jgi:hypothetical protein